MGILWVCCGYVMVLSAEYPLNVRYLSRHTLVKRSFVIGRWSLEWKGIKKRSNTAP